MTTVRAKFCLNSIERRRMTVWNSGGQSELKEVQTLKLTPVTSGSDENKSFFATTPTGTIELGCANAEAVAAFELGKEYYVDFTPATA